jgi:hypothetical protein
VGGARLTLVSSPKFPTPSDNVQRVAEYHRMVAFEAERLYTLIPDGFGSVTVRTIPDGFGSLRIEVTAKES